MPEHPALRDLLAAMARYKNRELVPSPPLVVPAWLWDTLDSKDEAWWIAARDSGHFVRNHPEENL